MSRWERACRRPATSCRLVTHQDFESLVMSHGVEFARRGQRTGCRRKHGGADRERSNFLAILSQMSKEAQAGALGVKRAPALRPARAWI